MRRSALMASWTAVGVVVLVSGTPSDRDVRNGSPDERILANDNRSPAGRLVGDTLVLELEVRRGGWFPGVDSGPSELVLAFAEVGKPLQIPGPLVRVPRGSAVRVSIRNTLLDSTLVMHGLYSRPAERDDTIQVRPGGVRDVSFDAGAPGTYFYWGSTSGTGIDERNGEESQLSGAMVIDSTTAAADDRVFLIGAWHEDPDTTRPKPWLPRDMMVINGKTWPHTERFDFAVGDTVRWRWVNPSADAHPMHLHGFYFDVTSRGAWQADTGYATVDERKVVTELMVPGSTLAMKWVPERPGNWLFHCHFGFHVSHYLALRHVPNEKDPDSPAEVDHTAGGMAGLILGIHVRGADAAGSAAPGSARAIELFLQAKPTGDTLPKFNYALVVQQGPSGPAPDSVPQRSSPLMLVRGEPVRINVINRLPYPSAIHWHGIELEHSYVDGVPGWSGTPGHLAPLVMPGDSFAVEFTPPRAGTFIYHSHSNEYYQIAAGLAAPLIVVDPEHPYDSSTDHPVLINQGIDGTGRVDGKAQPDPLYLSAGKSHRLRVINIAPDFRVWTTLSDSDGIATWRAIAKDGADLPPHQATSRPARVLMGPGETADFEVTPERAGRLTLTVATQLNGWKLEVPVVVGERE
jgi:FtsP/CotA-like multicopper oxidase with cupredoxin domain